MFSCCRRKKMIVPDSKSRLIEMHAQLKTSLNSGLFSESEYCLLDGRLIDPPLWNRLNLQRSTITTLRTLIKKPVLNYEDFNQLHAMFDNVKKLQISTPYQTDFTAFTMIINSLGEFMIEVCKLLNKEKHNTPFTAKMLPIQVAEAEELKSHYKAKI